MENENSYHIIYRITRDNHTYGVGAFRKQAETDDDLIFEMEDLQSEVLAGNGFSGERKDTTGSISVEEPDYEPYVDNGKLAFKEVMKTHYYNCEILEIMRELDEDADTYVRIWKNGNIG